GNLCVARTTSLDPSGTEMGHLVGRNKSYHDILEKPHEHLAMDRWERRTLARGGKARRVGRHPALACQKAIGEHDQRHVSMQPIPAPPLGRAQAAGALGVFLELLDGPAAVGHLDEAVEGRVRRQGTEVPLEVAAFAWHRALAEQPALWSRPDTVMTGGEVR